MFWCCLFSVFVEASIRVKGVKEVFAVFAVPFFFPMRFFKIKKWNSDWKKFFSNGGVFLSQP